MKILINTCCGGFCLSQEFQNIFNERHPDRPLENGRLGRKQRADTDIITLFEELGSEKSSDDYSKIEIYEIPYGMKWSVHDYDGMERVEYTLPYEQIIIDLLNIIKKRDVELNPFTKSLLEKDIILKDGILVPGWMAL